jgi:hypothetical protein
VTRVSFIVPTLNRGSYVVRAVASCLVAAQRAGVDGEVVVLDSQSDDGSWEALQEQFGSNLSVRLAQNQRGLGPTHSWLDGAELISGSFVTFVWSDDYVAPHFLTRLLPAMRDGATVAIGRGAIRDIDDVTPLTDREGAAELTNRQAIEGYLGTHPGMPDPPVSPASALFRRDAFDHWKGLVRTVCTSPDLRHQLMWRRAIGPDLLLYIDALAYRPDQHVLLSHSDVVQFSAHESSITIGSPPWLLQTGYWLSRTSAVLDLGALEGLPNAVVERLCARIILQGYALSRRVPMGQRGLEDVEQTAAMVREEAARIRAWLTARQGSVGLLRGFTRMAGHEIGRRLTRSRNSKT